MSIDIFSYKPEATAIRLFILAAISYLLLILFGESLSPLNDILVGDVVVFKMMGVAWREGYVPYRDFFDHKGPLHYLIQLISFSISNGKAGLLLLETLNTMVIFELLYRCGKDLGASIKLNVLSLFVSMNLFALFLSQGDNVEEWSLPFQIFPLWLAIKYLRGTFPSTKKLALITGACFGATTMIRLNNNCIVCGIVIGLLILLLSRKSYRELFVCVGNFIIGMVVIILPFVAYFYLNDAIGDMVYCNLIFNIHYKVSTHFSLMIIRPMVVIQLIQCLILPFTSWLYDRQHHTKIFPMMAIMSGLSLYTFLFSAGFEHYFLMVIPLTALCIQTSFGGIKSIILSLVLLSPIFLSPWNFNRFISCIAFKYIKKNTSTNHLDFIPEDERDLIYTFGSFDCLGDLQRIHRLPIGKYAFLQNVLGDVDFEVHHDIQVRFKESMPKWILSSSPADEMQPLSNIYSQYHLYYKDDRYYVYKLKD